jgi:type IV pilus assembly protein PilV
VWAGNYNIGAIDASGTAVPSCATGCNPVELATHDIAAWSQQVNTFLPNAHGSINCATAGLTYIPDATQQDMRPPYGGRCTMTLTWNEAGGAGGAQRTSLESDSQGQQPHTFTWVFQP